MDAFVGLTKGGPGVLRLDGNSTYPATTLVSAGMLEVNGSIASAVTVAANATLAGNGTIAGAVTDNGLLSPGAAGDPSIGTLTIGGGSAINGTLELEVPQFGTAGISHDQLAVSGSLTIGGNATLLLDLGGSSSGCGTVANGVTFTATHLTGNFTQTSTINNSQKPTPSVVYNNAGGHIDFSLVSPPVKVVSLLRSAPLGPTTNASSVSYALTFNEAVSGVAASDFRLTTSGSVQAATPVVVSGSGSNYTVTVNGIHGSGDLRLDLIDDDSIVGVDGPLGGAGHYNGSFQGQTYSILQPYPYVVSINGTTPVSLTTNASSVTYTVTFSEAVTGVNPTDFTLALNGVTATTPVVVSPASGPAAIYSVTVNGIAAVARWA